ncbi:MAG TPA: glycerol-3-phosphate dehydrogenase/oxidase [Gemmatimonadaceae bacterium]|nr:glycerol-3-phosphate dehydrogenase/oxidase [Gemmatimonadaceae bacterium]
MQGHATTRRERLAALGSRSFDLLVIGGGITGCGVAREAALRGLAVALVEKGDFASGTSSRSSRLVHGGVRYLETGQIHLVFEASAERRRLLRLAPHLVRPLAFTWPVYAGARVSRLKLGAGLFAYDALAMFRNVARHERLSARGVLEHEPMLRVEELRGGARYFDAATDDARLTLANAVGAVEAGAVMLNHASVRALQVDGGRVAGASVVDRLTGSELDVRASVVVNATGPWSDDLRALDELATTERSDGAAVRGSKGTHISVPRARVGNRDALTLLVPADGRVFFVLPAGAQAIIGTTDTFTAASPDAVRATRADVRYLLQAANAYFPRAGLRDDDVVSSWAGIRPLLPSAAASPGRVSREHAVAVSASGLVSITGGKLTTYRVMARDVVRTVAEQLGRRVKRRDPTRDVPLPGGDFASVDLLVEEAARLTKDETLAARLVGAHGTRWREVWREVQSDGGGELVESELPYTAGELRYSVEAELACTLGDLLIRRTHLAHQSRDHGIGAAARAAEAVAPLLGWDRLARGRAIRAFESEIEKEFSIDG